MAVIALRFVAAAAVVRTSNEGVDSMIFRTIVFSLVSVTVDVEELVREKVGWMGETVPDL